MLGVKHEPFAIGIEEILEANPSGLQVGMIDNEFIVFERVRGRSKPHHFTVMDEFAALVHGGEYTDGVLVLKSTSGSDVVKDFPVYPYKQSSKDEYKTKGAIGDCATRSHLISDHGGGKGNKIAGDNISTRLGVRIPPTVAREMMVNGVESYIKRMEFEAKDIIHTDRPDF